MRAVDHGLFFIFFSAAVTHVNALRVVVGNLRRSFYIISIHVPFAKRDEWTFSFAGIYYPEFYTTVSRWSIFKLIIDYIIVVSFSWIDIIIATFIFNFIH